MLMPRLGVTPTPLKMMPLAAKAIRPQTPTPRSRAIPILIPQAEKRTPTRLSLAIPVMRMHPIAQRPWAYRTVPRKLVPYANTASLCRTVMCTNATNRAISRSRSISRTLNRILQIRGKSRTLSSILKRLRFPRDCATALPIFSLCSLRVRPSNLLASMLSSIARTFRR